MLNDQVPGTGPQRLSDVPVRTFRQHRKF